MLKGLDEIIYRPQWTQRGVDHIDAEICPSKEILHTSIAMSLNRIAMASESIATSLMNASINKENA